MSDDKTASDVAETVREKILGRIAVLESSAETVERRLREGAETFTELRDTIKAIDERIRADLDQLKPKPVGRLGLVGFVFSAALAVGGLVWAASRYPERGEFQEVRRNLEGRTQELQVANTLVQRDMAEMREAVKRLEAGQVATATATASKLDQLLLRGAHP